MDLPVIAGMEDVDLPWWSPKWAVPKGQDLGLASGVEPQSHSQAGLCFAPTRFL